MRFPEVGELFAQKYRIEALLGSGGFSRVYKATQVDLEREVAIKILQPPVRLGAASEREIQERLNGLMSRFAREARMVSKLRSPHTITMYDYGRTRDGQMFMSLEFVDGLTLGQLIQAQGALSPDRVAQIMRQVLIALYEAHQMGMLHRDLKPQNIMVFEHMGVADQVKLLDFGIVKLIGQESTREVADLTADDTLVGTPRYMSPEYIRGEEIGPGADIYSFGLVAYELLVGERAIRADSSIQIIGMQLERDSFCLPPEIDIDPALRAIIDGMLEKDPHSRYAEIGPILEDLQARAQDPHTLPPHARRLQGIRTAPLPAADASAGPAPGPDPTAAWPPSEGDEGEDERALNFGERDRRQRAIIAAGFVGLLLMLVSAAVVAIAGADDAGQPSDSEAAKAEAPDGPTIQAEPSAPEVASSEPSPSEPPPQEPAQGSAPKDEGRPEELEEPPADEPREESPEPADEPAPEANPEAPSPAKVRPPSPRRPARKAPRQAKPKEEKEESPLLAPPRRAQEAHEAQKEARQPLRPDHRRVILPPAGGAPRALVAPPPRARYISEAPHPLSIAPPDCPPSR